MAKFSRVSLARKKDLNKPDEFINLSGKWLAFAIENKTKLITGCGVFLLLAIVFSGLHYYSSISESKASDLLAQGMEKYRMTVKEKGQTQAYQDVKEAFLSIEKTYPRTVAGKISAVYLANICFNAGNYEQAIEYYKKSINRFDDRSFLNNIVLSGLAYSYEAAGDKKNALEYFEKVASGLNAYMKDEAFFNSGALYAGAGDTQKSVKAFEAIISDYPDSIYIEIAKEKALK